MRVAPRRLSRCCPLRNEVVPATVAGLFLPAVVAMDTQRPPATHEWLRRHLRVACSGGKSGVRDLPEHVGSLSTSFWRDEPVARSASMHRTRESITCSVIVGGEVGLPRAQWTSPSTTGQSRRSYDHSLGRVRFPLLGHMCRRTENARPQSHRPGRGRKRRSPSVAASPSAPGLHRHRSTSRTHCPQRVHSYS